MQLLHADGGKYTNWRRTNWLCFAKKGLDTSLWRVLFANNGAKAHLGQASKQTGSKVRAARIVAEICGKLFFEAVRRREACLNRYLRHWKPQSRYLYFVINRDRRARDLKTTPVLPAGVTPPCSAIAAFESPART